MKCLALPAPCPYILLPPPAISWLPLVLLVHALNTGDCSGQGDAGSMIGICTTTGGQYILDGTDAGQAAAPYARVKFTFDQVESCTLRIASLLCSPGR